MSEDWRVEVDVREGGVARMLTDRLEARELEADLVQALHDRVAVSRDEGRVFIYAGTREQAESARETIAGIVAANDWAAEIELRRWHPGAEDWEDPDAPLPEGEAAAAKEHAALMATERREAEERGYPEFEVRVDLSSRHEAAAFAEKLTKEGIPAVHRWRYLLVGAASEDDAKALAERIGSEAPADSKAVVEGTWKATIHEAPPNPYAVFGGLGA
jgi:hypothetical protein